MLDHLIPADEAQRLATLRSLHLTEAPPDERLDRIVRLAARMLRVPIAYVSLVEENVVWIRSSVGLDVPCLAREELGYWLGMGQQAIGRLVRLTSDLLDDERLRSGAMPLRVRACTSAAIFEEAAWTMRGEADKAGVAIAVTPPTVAFRADHDRMLQLVVNLLGNAVKFSPAGTKVTLRAEDHGDRVRLVVADQGRGIPRDRLEAIFERFEQVELDDAAVKGGTGLGLSICRAIAQQHGGRLWAENREAGGSRFIAELPKAGP